MTSTARVAALYVYPIKSCGGVPVARAALEERGLARDRRWMLVDSSGRFVSQRKHPALALAHPALAPDGALTVRAPNLDPLHLSRDSVTSDTLQVELFDDSFLAALATPDAHAWFSRMLGVDVRLVRMTDASDRPVDHRFDDASPGAQVSFADGFPYLVTTTATIEHVDALVDTHEIDWRRFRPNVVLEVPGGAPFVEDQWARVEHPDGDFALHCAKPCARCVVITVDPDRGVHAGPEPTRTLARIQPGEKVIFGQNALRTGEGELAVGDTLNLVARP